jgi:hypothetical protein
MINYAINQEILSRQGQNNKKLSSIK